MAALLVCSAVLNIMDSSEIVYIMGGLSVATTKIALSKEFSQAKEIL